MSEPSVSLKTAIEVTLDLEAQIRTLVAELATVRRVLNADLKIASERVLTLELKHRRLRPALDTLRETVKAYDEGNRRQPRVYEQELAEAARALVALLQEPLA